MLTKKIHKQMLGGFFALIIWLAAAAFFVYIGVRVYFEGTGVHGRPGLGLKGIVSSLLRKLEEQGHEEIVKWILIALCAAAFLYLMYHAVQTVFSMMPKNTRLGKSVCAQLKENQSFKDLCKEIDKDMERDHKVLGADVYVSSSWIFEEEVMRLGSVKKIYIQRKSMDHNLILEADNGELLKLEFVFSEVLDEALEYIKRRLPLVKISESGTVGVSGRMYSWHVPKTAEEIEEYKRLANQGDVSAQIEYGKCLLFGKGAETDEKAAYEWFTKAASSRSEMAKMYQGHCILYGTGTEKNEEEGYKILNAALEYNYPEESESQPLADYSEFQDEDLVQMFWDLGDAFENGLGIGIRYASAAYYFNMIDSWGHPEGAQRMAHYKKKLSGWKKID